MKCTACGSEWNTTKTVQCCPFCGANLTQAFQSESKREQRCPVCDKALPEGTACRECGYDPSCDAETFGTIFVVLLFRMNTLARQRREYVEKKLETPQVLPQQAALEMVNVLQEPLCALLRTFSVIAAMRFSEKP